MTQRIPVAIPDTPWAEHAACKGHDHNQWFPEIGTDLRNHTPTLSALAVCRTCPVRSDCLTYALDHEAHGVWGGMTPRERDRHRMGLGRSPMLPGRHGKRRDAAHV